VTWSPARLCGTLQHGDHDRVGRFCTENPVAQFQIRDIVPDLMENSEALSRLAVEEEDLFAASDPYDMQEMMGRCGF
jgi:hypothetical protein